MPGIPASGVALYILPAVLSAGLGQLDAPSDAERPNAIVVLADDLVSEEMEAIKQAELSQMELYDLESDIGETKDLAEEHPERLARMSAALQQLYREVRDESPVWPAWEWPRYESKRIIWKLDSPPRQP